MITKYLSKIQEASETIDASAFENFIQQLDDDLLFCNRTPIIFFGNGGSAAIANHAVCDFGKGISEDTTRNPVPVISLSSNVELITAIANDFGYEHIFSKQLEYLNFPKAHVVAISSSGNSPNIIEGLKTAKKRKYATTALVGFDGGKVCSIVELAENAIHVKSNNYGIVEDVHMMLIHIAAQHFREKYHNKILPLKL